MSTRIWIGDCEPLWRLPCSLKSISWLHPLLDARISPPYTNKEYAMIPRMDRSSSPPFHELDEYTFQNLCCDLHARQPAIATCDVYGTRGQRQRGIDLLAHRHGSMGKKVGQCKCYDDFPLAEIGRYDPLVLEDQNEVPDQVPPVPHSSL